MHYVLESPDLLPYVLKFVEGDESKNCIAFETIPQVASFWERVWKQHYRMPVVLYVNPFLCHLEYKHRCITIERFPALFHEATKNFRDAAIRFLQRRLRADGIPTLFILAMVQIGFMFNVSDVGCPCCTGCPIALWAHIVRLRHSFAKKLLLLPQEKLPVPWYLPLPDMGDPVCRALKIKMKRHQ